MTFLPSNTNFLLKRTITASIASDVIQDLGFQKQRTLAGRDRSCSFFLLFQMAMVFCFSLAALTKKVTVNLCFNFLLPFACFHFSANHTNEISTKLIKGNAMLSKLRHFVNKDILLSVYYGIFHPHLAYLCLVLGQAKFYLNRITLLLNSPQDIAFCWLQGSYLCSFSKIQSFTICRHCLVRKLHICQ